jgi:glycosyltransferase involved in cell wall biosynthesis
MHPGVSIVLPFRNEEHTIAECLASVAAQSFEEYEVLAIDDGTTDASTDVVARAAAADPRIRLLRTGRIGLVAALNRGLEEARAPLVARMDADDVMHRERLAEQVAFLERAPDVVVVGCQVSIISDGDILAGFAEYVRWQNSCVTSDEIANNIYVESPLAHPSVLFRKNAVAAAGGYRDGDFPEDYELWLRMHANGAAFGKVARVLLDWRERPERATRCDPRYAREAFDRVRGHYLARDPRLRAGRAIVIWGSGRRTRQRAANAIREGVVPSAWIDIDQDKVGRDIAGVPVHSPAWLLQEPRPFVLLYLTQHGAREEAGAKLERMGYAIGRDWLGVG